jgi:hypothetical protein
MLICIALDDAYTLGVLSSRVHVVWALATGGRLGVGNDPRYNKSRCFETFPFPEATPEQQTRIAALAEQLDALRKRVLAEHPDLTLTGLYNVLEKERAGAALTSKEKDTHQRGLVGVLRSLHDELDAEVLAAYGWSDQPDSATLLERLTALNTQRSAEEAAGTVRWLRPDYQNPTHRHSRAGGNPVQQSDLGLGPELTNDLDSRLRGNDSVAKTPWPATLPEQVAAVARVLVASPIPLDETAIAARFTGKGPWKKRLPPLLETLVALGRARRVEGGYVGE